jgi:hypothetical protein
MLAPVLRQAVAELLESAEHSALQSHRAAMNSHGAGYDAGEVSGIRKLLEIITVRRCRVCGCTEADCSQCIGKTGAPCFWVGADLCSACEINPSGVDGLPDGG